MSNKRKNNSGKRRKKRGCLGTVLLLLILAIAYFSDLFGFFDFPGNGGGDGYKNFLEEVFNKDITGTENNKLTQTPGTTPNVTPGVVPNVPLPTSTPQPTNTSVPNTPAPTNTAAASTPKPTSSPTPLPTNTPLPTSTPKPTSTPLPTATPASERISLTITAKDDYYVISGTTYTFAEVSTLLQKENTIYTVYVISDYAIIDSYNKLIDLLEELKIVYSER